MAYGMDEDIENAGKILESLLVQVKEMAESSIHKDEIQEGLERIELMNYRKIFPNQVSEDYFDTRGC